LAERKKNDIREILVACLIEEAIVLCKHQAVVKAVIHAKHKANTAPSSNAFCAM